jgi:hypothetical protein
VIPLITHGCSNVMDFKTVENESILEKKKNQSSFSVFSKPG